MTATPTTARHFAKTAKLNETAHVSKHVVVQQDNEYHVFTGNLAYSIRA